MDHQDHQDHEVHKETEDPKDDQDHNRRGGVAVSETTVNVMITNKFTNIRSKVNERNRYNFYYYFPLLAM